MPGLPCSSMIVIILTGGSALKINNNKPARVLWVNWNSAVVFQFEIKKMKFWRHDHRILEICVPKVEFIAQRHTYIAVSIPNNTYTEFQSSGS